MKMFEKLKDKVAVYKQQEVRPGFYSNMDIRIDENAELYPNEDVSYNKYHSLYVGMIAFYLRQWVSAEVPEKFSKELIQERLEYGLIDALGLKDLEMRLIDLVLNLQNLGAREEAEDVKKILKEYF